MLRRMMSRTSRSSSTEFIALPVSRSADVSRTRFDSAVYDAVFRLVLGIVEAKGLLRGKVAGVDSTYLRADASMKTIVRKDTGDDYTTYFALVNPLLGRWGLHVLP